MEIEGELSDTKFIFLAKRFESANEDFVWDPKYGEYEMINVKYGMSIVKATSAMLCLIELNMFPPDFNVVEYIKKEFPGIKLKVE